MWAHGSKTILVLVKIDSLLTTKLFAASDQGAVQMPRSRTRSREERQGLPGSRGAFHSRKRVAITIATLLKVSWPLPF